MRDILVTVLVFGSLPFILRRPFFGVIVWTWLGLMNPHRLAWGFSTTLPFALIVFIATALSYGMSRDAKNIHVSREIALLGIFVVWMFITTIYSWYPHLAWTQWDKVWRIQLGILLTLMLTTNRERIHLIVWTICVSLGFYGLKGGIWFVMTGGSNRVYGPFGSFISGNNEIGLALVMTVPLLWYLIMSTRPLWIRSGLYAALFFSLIAIIGTHSRGALLGLLVMGTMFIIKARRKFVPILGAIAFAASLPYIAPEEWFQRMNTIESYEQDESAMQRIRTWKVATGIANSSVLGGGFDVLLPANGTDAHSIYFEVLSEQGYIGLVMFLSLGLLTFLKAQRIKNLTKNLPDYNWARDLATMIQTSLAGYAASGAFLGLAYFDLGYLLIALVVVLHKVVTEDLKQFTPVPQRVRAPYPAGLRLGSALTGQKSAPPTYGNSGVPFQ